MIKNNKPATQKIKEENETCCRNTSCCAAQTPAIRTAPKVGRNEPCPCGSERKFKKCCG